MTTNWIKAIALADVPDEDVIAVQAGDRVHHLRFADEAAVRKVVRLHAIAGAQQRPLVRRRLGRHGAFRPRAECVFPGTPGQ